MRIAILGFVAGAAWLQTQAALPEFPWLLPGGGLALAGALLAAYAPGGPPARRMALPPRRLPPRRLLALAAGLMLGFGWAALLAARALAPQLAAADEGRDLTLIGVVDNLPYRFSDGVRFQFKVESVVGGAALVPPRVALSWYAGQRGVVNQVGAVRPGERWRLTVRLQRPHGNANPYGFDYEVWLLEQGVRATGYVRPAGGNRRLDGFVASVGNAVERCRDALRERILTALPGREYAGVLVALVVGEQRGIAQSDWQVFNRTGIGHLISISGLHITMVAGLAALALSALWRRSFFTHAQLPLRLPAQKVAALTGAGVALLYVLLAGFGVPAQRTLYMLAVVAVALWLDRITSVSHVLCAALGLVVLLDPWAVLWPGFWLSFGAVALIMYATVGRTLERIDDAAMATAGLAPAAALARTRARRAWLALRLGAHTQYVVTCGLVPLTMLLFAQVSLVSPLANAVAIPLVSLVVTPLALLGSVMPTPLAVPVLGLAHWLVQALAACLQWFSGWELAVWCAPTPSWWLFGWAMLGTLWLLAPRGWPGRWLGLLSWIPLLTATPARPPAGQFWVTALDVGQGMALLVETAGHRLLYDTGPTYSPESNGGNRVILPYLRARGIAELDGMVVSHSDIDHAGGALTVLGGVRVGWLLSSLSADHAIVRAAPRHAPCVAGQGWSWDGVRFEVLHPLADSYADVGLKPNARGCTLRISAGGRAMLLAADIEAAQEAALLARAPDRLRADVLLAPHHGSGTSSTLPFLLAVRPELALFQVGYRNRYHHPKAEVFERYGVLGVRRLRSDEAGAVTLAFGAELDVAAYRQQHARYWYAR
ncbi:DNA internalization-related competence protein ComEC/Rec2 [Rugamonas sp. CCM 8940]|uniref:DNA internalization-related competence protein ComEC/Rec2 n=1 Tax=Rugamonas sp. CCM 8940 TaxID=2765359 RepID=UPI0018F74418|nr:DNA internalization-related competence protein ComEC/Rec2 [Rugamonas sp. CCM 8940]MBJ7313508.1 DNA internalization-related competence protein ComEC/Rec2 [Rugamonas sp. CCM 8940]